MNTYTQNHKIFGECLFVELKGNDCLHAAEQIANTIKWFKSTKINPFILLLLII